MKRVKLILLTCLLCLFTLVLSSCGGFVAEEESIIITSISYSKPQEDGSIILTIVYEVEGEEQILEHRIPKGDKGDTGTDGNGIASITYKTSEDGSKTICTITYTDEEITPTEVEIPNGSSVASLESYVDEETGGTVVTFILEDGTKLDPILLPKGKDGIDGVGIQKIDHTIDEETGDTILKITLDDEENTETAITIKKGATGRGISSIVSSEKDGKYVLTIYYTEGDPDEIMFDKPKDPNAWYSGNTTPSRTLGVDGDYYFDEYAKTIYCKSNGSWRKIAELKSVDKEYTVTFDPNEGILPDTFWSSYIIISGQNFISSGYTSFPVPVREGYRFVGWYTSKNPTVVNGIFTDLTYVFSDITLYAKWEEKVE